jgi:hypothetical protein
MPAYVRRYKGSSNARFLNAIGDTQPLGIAPSDLPQFLRGSPDGAETLRALSQFGFLKGDAYGNDLVVAPARMARPGVPGD